MLMIEKLPTRYFAGRASVQAGSNIVTPHDAVWASNVWGDDLFFLRSQPLVPPQRIEQINEDGTVLLADPWPGIDAVEADYEIRYVGIIERSTAQSRRVLEQLGDVKSWADVFVATDADRLALESPSNPLRAGFRVLVTEDGIIWAKASGAYEDWLPPASFKGDQGIPGPYTDITFGPVTTVSPTTPASAVAVPVGDAAIRIDLSIPKGADGLGTVAGIDQGAGIAVDVSDPTRPVVSLDAKFLDLKDVDFTTDPPEDGDVPVWDAVQEKFVPGAGGGSGSGLQIIKEFTSSGAWSPTDPANLKGVLVEVQGAGGGGGGSGANNAAGGGGGAGGNSEKFIPAEDLGASEEVVVGAAGSGGATGANNGSAGGASSFGAFLSATGGDGGQHATGSSMPNNGGTGTGGDINLTGGSGVPRLNGGAISSTPGGNAPKGLGFGGGSLPATVNANGSNGSGFGSGGGGGLRVSASVAGGNGAPGVVIVREFY